MYKHIFVCICDDLMVAYLTNSGLTTATRREGYVSWEVYDLFLTPAHKLIHNCIRYWTQEWDTALNMSAVCPNSRQGIIAMLSDGTLGRFREPSRGKRMNMETLEWRLKMLLPCF